MLTLLTVDELVRIGHQTFDQHRNKFLCVAISFSVAWLYNNLWINRKRTLHTKPMLGKTVLITGGNAGIGYETAQDLLKRGARVIIACRNMEKGRKAIDQLLIDTNCDETKIRLMKCDLASQSSVRDFARTFNDEEERLDLLICNAGLVLTPNKITDDGFNTVIQSNYLGHFLLTNLLIEKLKACRPSRIVNVSSAAHKTVRSIDWSDAFTQHKLTNIFKCYGMSKAFQILSTEKLKRDHLADGINCFAVHPGWVWTSIHEPIRENFGFCFFAVVFPILYLFKIALAKTPRTGALTTIYCAIEPSLEASSAIYFENCDVSSPTDLCKNQENADKLWKLSCEAVNL